MYKYGNFYLGPFYAPKALREFCDEHHLRCGFAYELKNPEKIDAWMEDPNDWVSPGHKENLGA